MAAADGSRRSVEGLSEIEFRERLGAEEACRKALFEMRWREGLACPACVGRSSCELKARKVFRCDRCKRRVRLTAGTVFQDSKLPLTTWFLAICHLAQARHGSCRRGGGGLAVVSGPRLSVYSQTLRASFRLLPGHFWGVQPR